MASDTPLNKDNIERGASLHAWEFWSVGLAIKFQCAYSSNKAPSVLSTNYFYGIQN